jgi:hypothetical protein
MSQVCEFSLKCLRSHCLNLPDILHLNTSKIVGKYMSSELDDYIALRLVHIYMAALRNPRRGRGATHKGGHGQTAIGDAGTKL